MDESLVPAEFFHQVVRTGSLPDVITLYRQPILAASHPTPSPVPHQEEHR